MEDVVHAMDHHGSVFLAQGENALDPQQCLAAPLAQRRQPAGDGVPVERLIESQAKRGNPVRVAVMMVMGVIVIVICFLVQPAPGVRRFGRRIEQRGAEQGSGIDSAIADFQNGRRGVQGAQPRGQVQGIRQIGLGQ